MTRTMFGEEAKEVDSFDVLHIGQSEVASAVNTLDGYKYVLVFEGDLSGFVWLVPAKGILRPKG